MTDSVIGRNFDDISLSRSEARIKLELGAISRCREYIDVLFDFVSLRPPTIVALFRE